MIDVVGIWVVVVVDVDLFVKWVVLLLGFIFGLCFYLFLVCMLFMVSVV